jgi:hypothetical protein
VKVSVETGQPTALTHGLGVRSVILAAGAGVYARTHIVETRGIFLPESTRTPEMIAEHFNEFSNSGNLETPRKRWLNVKSFPTVRSPKKKRWISGGFGVASRRQR